jgi:hypothetical protein
MHAEYLLIRFPPSLASCLPSYPVYQESSRRTPTTKTSLAHACSCRHRHDGQADADAGGHDGPAPLGVALEQHEFERREAFGDFALGFPSRRQADDRRELTRLYPVSGGERERLFVQRGSGSANPVASAPVAAPTPRADTASATRCRPAARRAAAASKAATPPTGRSERRRTLVPTR